MFRFLTLILISIISIPALAIATSAKAQEFTAAQKAEIVKMFDAYLAENGEKIIDSVDTYQNKQAEADKVESEKLAKTFLKELEAKDNLPMTGNPKGDITMIEFFDYNCGYCRRALEEIVDVLEDDKNLKVIFFDMPILGPASLEASKWSLAAHNQDKYFEYHQALLEHKGQKTENVYKKIANDLKLDFDKLKTDKDSDEIEKTLKENVAAAQAMNIRGTPGFIINGKIFPGYMPASRITEILKNERAAQKE